MVHVSQHTYVEGQPDFGKHPATRFTYRREPYVRATLQRTDGGTETVDAKAVRWTATHICINWVADGETFDFWVPADTVTRITRRESSWKDVYDQAEGYPDGEY